MNVSTILHLDDDAMILHGIGAGLTKDLSPLRFRILSTDRVESFLLLLQKHTVDCVLLDLHLGQGDGDGIKVLRQIRKSGFDRPILILSADDDSVAIHAAMHAGANDFVIKNEDTAELAMRITFNLDRYEAAKAESPRTPYGGATAERIMAMMPRLIRSEVSSVLVRGETGSGKEVVAASLRASLASDVPFVTVNCGAISDQLLESELFGYEKGSFTGAQGPKQGLFSSAHRGWLFLDEVARLSKGCQAALLRALDSGEIRPVGSTQTIHVSVRVIAATNEDLEAMVAAGEFRRDLLERLRGHEITLPPLRERRDEIPDIVDALLKMINEPLVKKGEQAFRLSSAARSLLLAHDWRHGNIREVRQVLQSSTVEAEGRWISAANLPDSFLAELDIKLGSTQQASASFELQSAAGDPRPTYQQRKLPIQLLQLEDQLFLDCLNMICTLLAPSEQTQRHVARSLGITRYVLYSKLKRLNSAGWLPLSYRHLLPSHRDSADCMDDSKAV